MSAACSSRVTVMAAHADVTKGLGIVLGIHVTRMASSPFVCLAKAPVNNGTV
jgi:alkanesulfonate monooxygenase SsuD/methylene tetrahydromethanopterin reductase-like flavin-dependent oxidoreductase (luciferase family)